MVRLDGARRRVARLMEDTCSIRRPKAIPFHEIDPVTGDILDPVEAGPIYAGRCLVLRAGYRADDRDRAGAEAAKNSNTLSIPWDAPDLRPGDLVSIGTSQDPTLAGRRFVVRDVVRTSFLVWRQATIEQVEVAHD